MENIIVNQEVEYLTHCNGGRPYKVIIQNNSNVSVYKSMDYDDENYNCLVLNVNPQKIFIGQSHFCNMTEFSGGYGDSFNGNSILLQITETSYTYIGEKIKLFHTKYPIVSYHSPVGNNDVPYPYAVDSEFNYYLIIEDVVVKKTVTLDDYLHDSNPYDYYYDASLITKCLGSNKEPLFENNHNIDRFYCGKEAYTLRYDPNPANEYDRLTEPPFGKHLFIRDKNGKKFELTKNKFIELMEDYGKIIGAEQLQVIQILDEPY